MSKLAKTLLLCFLLQACSSTINPASSQCMEQVDLTDSNNTDVLEDTSQNCLDNSADTKPSSVPSNSIFETAILEVVVGFLNSLTN